MKHFPKLFLAWLLAYTPMAFAVSTGSCYDTADTVLMMHFDGSDAATTFTDSDGAKSVTAGGDAQLDTADKKFGTAALLLDGTGDYVTSADSADWDLGTGDYTIDFWVNMDSVASERIFLDRAVTADFTYRLDSTNFEVWQESSRRIQTTSHGISTGTWTHVALVRSSGTLTAYIAGTSIASSASSTQDIQGTVAIFIGQRADATGFYDGWIDEFRIVKGTAVWTSNFTPPAAAYTDCNAAVPAVSVLWMD